MSNPTNAPKPNPSRRWLRWTLLAIFLFGIIAILLAFLLTSSAFLRTVLLPRIGKSFHAEITADDIALRPFSSLTLTGIRIHTVGPEPVFAADEVHLRYRLRNLLAGRLELEELTLAGSTLHVIEQPDGSRNLDPLLKDRNSKARTSTDPDQAPSVDVRNLAVHNSSLRWTRVADNGDRTDIQFTGINAALDRFANDAAGQFTISSRLDADVTQAARIDRLEAELTAFVAFDLDPDLQLRSLVVNGTNSITLAEGAWAELADSHALLEIDWAADHLARANAQFLRGEQILGQIRAAGPLNLARSEGTLTLVVDEIGHPLLNLAGAPMNLQFANSRIDALMEIALLRRGTSIALSGRINATPLTLIHGVQSSPALDLHLGFQTLIQPDAHAARLQTFTFHGRQDRRVIIEADLSRPVNLSWAHGLTAADETTLTVQLNRLSLVDWQPFLNQLFQERDLPAWTATDGAIHANQVVSQSGNRTTLQGSFTLTDFTGTWAESPFRDYHATSRIEASHTGTRLELQEFSTTFGRGQARGGSLHLDGSLDLEAHAGQFTLSAQDLNQLALGPFLDPFFAPHQVRSIALNGTSSITLEPEDRGQFRAQLQITNLITGSSSPPSSTSPLRADLEFETTWRTGHESTHRTSLPMENASETVSGESHKVIAGFGGALRDATVRSVLSLPPTARAENELRLTGNIDVSENNPASSKFQLTANSIDLTPIYDLFFPVDAPATPTPTPAPAPGDPSPETEPDPMDLAMGGVTLETRIDQLFLRETHLSNVVVTTTLHGSKVRLHPITASIDGAPLSAQLDLDLGVPGWRYDLNLRALDMPIDSLVDSFAPKYRTQYRGLVQADVALQGQGITAPSLQEHLEGHFNVTFTNAQIQIVAPKFQRILLPISRLLRLPQFTESPLDWVRLQSRVGDGQIQLDELALESAAFQARTSGSIPIETDPRLVTLNLPLRFHLRRSLADQARLVPPNTTPEAAYVPLPDFATVRGTFHDPKTDLNHGAITSLLIRSGIGIAEEQGLKLDQPATRLLRGIGDILGGVPLPGVPSTTEPEPDTNRPPSDPVPAP